MPLKPSVPILISAAEVSSDRHAALVLRALRRKALEAGVSIEAFGVGGPALRAEGLDCLVPAEALLSMGITEVFSRLPRILRSMRALELAARLRKPKVALVVDYPDFHLRLARKLKRQGVRVVDFIPPKVWVWRKGRARLLAELFARVFCIFPFEPEEHRKLGLDSEYVGNPLAEQLPLELTRDEARVRLGVPGAVKRVIAVLPGSRPGELQRHFEPMLVAACRVRDRELGGVKAAATGIEIALPLSEQTRRTFWENRLAQLAPQARLSFGVSAEVLRAADAAIVKSGTSTLEAALLGCPHVVGYQMSPLSSWVARTFVRPPGSGPVSLTNLFTGWKPGEELRVPEFILESMTVEALERALSRYFLEPDYRAEVEKKLSDLKAVVLGGVGARLPSERVADALWSICRGGS